MPCWAWSRWIQIQSPGVRSVVCRAASSCSLVQRRALNQNVGSPSARSAEPSLRDSSTQRTSARAPFSCGRTYGVCNASTGMRHSPVRDASRVSGYASPGPPPYHRAVERLPHTPSRTPSLGSGQGQSPYGRTDTSRRSRSLSAVQWYSVSRARSVPAGATRVRTTTACRSHSTDATRCRIRCSPTRRHCAARCGPGCQGAPSSLSVGARHTSSWGPFRWQPSRYRSTPVVASKAPGPRRMRLPSPCRGEALGAVGRGVGRGGAAGSCPQATSCPAAAQAVSAARVARTVHRASRPRRPAGSGGSATSAWAPGASGGTVSGPSASTSPSAS